MITYILFYLIWNTQIHYDHPTLIPILFTLYTIYFIINTIVTLYELINF